jgi:tetratricopeptide (TPR) repeat protein
MWALPAEGMARSREFALRALEVNDSVPEAHTALGLVKLFHDWDFAGAGEHFDKALQLNPGYVLARGANAQRLAFQGRIEEAVAEARLAQELDPLSARDHNRLGWLEEWNGDDRKAVEHFEKARELSPTGYAAYWDLGHHYCKRGMAEKGIPLLESARRLNPERPKLIAEFAYCYALSGDHGKAREFLKELQKESESRYVSPMAFALAYVGLGETDEALAWLQKAYDLRAPGLLYALTGESAYDPLRSDPRFDDLVRRIGFPEK